MLSVHEKEYARPLYIDGIGRAKWQDDVGFQNRIFHPTVSGYFKLIPS